MTTLWNSHQLMLSCDHRGGPALCSTVHNCTVHYSTVLFSTEHGYQPPYTQLYCGAIAYYFCCARWKCNFIQNWHTSFDLLYKYSKGKRCTEKPKFYKKNLPSSFLAIDNDFFSMFFFEFFPFIVCIFICSFNVFPLVPFFQLLVIWQLLKIF